MPLVTLTVRRPKDTAFKTAILDAVHDALVAVGVPPADRFHRVIELDAEDFRYDGRYPDLGTPRGDDFALVEVLWSVGRSVRVKKQFLATLVGGVTAAGLDPEHLMVVFKETTWENWSFGGGRLLHV
jgi:phenylpyruvate tautomerase PptA (4-oxalocrotonate tautomerase family)